jgi:hypothetical protein
LTSVTIIKEKGGKMEEFVRLWQESVERGEFVRLKDGDRLVALPLVVPGARGRRRVYLGEYRDLYYRRGKWYYRIGRLDHIDRLGLVRSPLKRKKEKKLPRSVENLFRFFRTASPDLNPLVWQDALEYLEKLRTATGLEGDPEHIYRALNEKGWKEDYPLPPYYLWDGASLKNPWTSLRSLTGGLWDVEGGLKRLAKEALEKGVAEETLPSMKYRIRVSFRTLPDLPGYETGISVEYQGLAHGHYGLVVNWRGTVFLSESD